MNPILAELFAKCASCGHAAVSHVIVKGVRRACCHGEGRGQEAKICDCRKFVAP